MPQNIELSCLINYQNRGTRFWWKHHKIFQLFDRIALKVQFWYIWESFHRIPHVCFLVWEFCRNKLCITMGISTVESFSENFQEHVERAMLNYLFMIKKYSSFFKLFLAVVSVHYSFFWIAFQHFSKTSFQFYVL